LNGGSFSQWLLLNDPSVYSEPSTCLERLLTNPKFRNYFIEKGISTVDNIQDNCMEWFDNFITFIYESMTTASFNQFITIFLEKTMPYVRNRGRKPTADDIFNVFIASEKFINNVTLMEDHASPVIIWEKFGVIHYINKAFRNLTGWDGAVPTSHTQYAFYKFLSTDSFVELVIFLMELVSDEDNDTFYIPLEWNTNRGPIKTTACITLLKDNFNFPFLLLGVISPLVTSPVVGTQLKMFSSTSLT